MDFSKGLKKLKDKLNVGNEDFIEALYLGFDDNYGEAIKVLDEIIEVSPFGVFGEGKALVLTFKSIALTKLNRYDEALDAINKAVNHNKKDSFSWSIKGDILHELERKKEALDAYEMALKYSEKGDQLEIIWNRVDVLSHLGRHEEALEKFKEIVKAEPDSAEAWFGIADELLELDRLEESLDACKKGLKIDRNNIDLVIHYGNLMLNLEKYEESLKYFQKATNLDSRDELAWYNQACVLSKLDRKEEALDALTVSTGINPENKELMESEEDFENIKNEKRYTRLLKQSL